MWRKTFKRNRKKYIFGFLLNVGLCFFCEDPKVFSVSEAFKDITFSEGNLQTLLDIVVAHIRLA